MMRSPCENLLEGQVDLQKLKTLFTLLISYQHGPPNFLGTLPNLHTGEPKNSGGRLSRRCCLTNKGITVIRIRQSSNHLIITMGISVPDGLIWPQVSIFQGDGLMLMGKKKIISRISYFTSTRPCQLRQPTKAPWQHGLPTKHASRFYLWLTRLLIIHYRPVHVG